MPPDVVWSISNPLTTRAGWPDGGQAVLHPLPQVALLLQPAVLAALEVAARHHPDKIGNKDGAEDESAVQAKNFLPDSWSLLTSYLSQTRQ